MLHADTAARDSVTGVVQRALEESGAHSTTRATNVLFEHITGVNPYRLTSIFVHDDPIRSPVGARTLRERVATLLDARLADASTLLGFSDSRFSRNDNLDREILDRTHAILDTYVSVAAALGPMNAAEWFNTPHPALDEVTPMQLLKTSYGRKLVDDLVSALQAGSYV